MLRWIEERPLMMRRWLKDTEHHRWSDWYCDLYGLPKDDCACLRGYGYYRKLRREGYEGGSNSVSFYKRKDRRDERHGARAMIEEQMVDGMPIRVKGDRRSGTRRLSGWYF